MLIVLLKVETVIKENISSDLIAAKTLTIPTLTASASPSHLVSDKQALFLTYVEWLLRRDG